MGGDRDDGGSETAHWGNGASKAGMSVGAHIASAAVSSVISLLVAGVFFRFVDHSDSATSQIAAVQIANAASSARVETEVAALKAAVDRLSERPGELNSDHIRDIQDVRAVEARDIERLEARLDQLERGRR